MFSFTFYAIALIVFDSFIKWVIRWRDYARPQEGILNGTNAVDSHGILSNFPKLIELFHWYDVNFSVKHSGIYSYFFLVGLEVFEMMMQFYNINILVKHLTWKSLTLYNAVVASNRICFALGSLLPEHIFTPGHFLTLDISFGEWASEW